MSEMVRQVVSAACKKARNAEVARNSAEPTPKPPSFVGREIYAVCGASSFTFRMADKVLWTVLSISRRRIGLLKEVEVPKVCSTFGM